MVSLCFGELGGLGVEVFDAGGQAVHDMGFLVGACHCGGPIGSFRSEELDGGGMRGGEEFGQVSGTQEKKAAARRNNGEAGKMMLCIWA